MIAYNVTYNGVDLHVINNTMVILNKRAKEVRHYPGTDKSTIIDLGREATSIFCELLATTESQKLLLEQLMNSDAMAELYINGEGRFYKDVTPDGDFEMSQATVDGKFWTAPASFIALDPVPYSVETGEALY